MSGSIPSSLPSKDYIFQVDIQGERSGQKFTGEFHFRMPNLKATAKAERMRAELNGPSDELLDISVKQLHVMIAYLRYTLLEAPKWWVDNDWGYSLDDFNVVREIYEKTQTFEKEYLEKIWGKTEQPSQTVVT